MPTFDGDNLIITMDSGVTEADLFDNLFEPWKAWMLGNPANRKYPQAFRSDGGNPLSSIINQGSYIFLNNADGWRIRPPEEDITIYLTGNLAVEDSSLPAFVPTVGAFTAAILGLQPVTQGVTPSMASQLEFNVFQGAVCVDVANGYAGTGYNGNDPIGSRKAPSNNFADALSIALSLGINKFNILSDATLASGDFSSGYHFTADSLQTTLTISAAADVSNCSVSNITIAGEMDGLNRIYNADVGAITEVSGQITGCDLNSTIGLSGSIHIISCYSGIAATGYPTITDIGSSEIVVRDMRGSLGVAGMTGGAHSIGVYGGRLVIEASCSGGTIYVRGDPYEILDLSGGAVTLVDQTSSLKLTEIHKIMGLDDANPMTVTPTSRVAGGVSQVISGDGQTTSTVTRQ